MNEGFAWWLLIAGIGLGVALAWLIMGRISRTDDDVDEAERAEEAAWISRTIAAYGGVAPPALVEEILELHRSYLEGPGFEPSGRLPRDAADAADADSDEAPEAGGTGGTVGPRDDGRTAVAPTVEPRVDPARRVRTPAGGSPRRASGES